MPHSIRLETERLSLRAPQLADAEVIQRMVSQYEIARYTLNIPHPYPENGVTEWLERIEERMASGEKFYNFMMILKTNAALIGSITINLEERHNRSEIGYWLDLPYWNQGYVTEASQRIIQFGFADLGLQRICASYFTQNAASRRVMEKAGMQFEGVLRQHIQRDGIFYDLGYCGIVRSDWEAQQNG